MSDGFLFTITSTVDFIALVTSVWLGFYILTRNPRKMISWLACGTLWSFSGSFLNSLIYIHAPPASGDLPWWWGWSVTMAIAFWFHLSVSILSRTQLRVWWWVSILVYFLALNFIAMQTYTNLVFEDNTVSLSLLHNAVKPGPLYAFYAMFLILVLVISFRNLLKAKQISGVLPLQRQIVLLIIANGFATFGVLYDLISTGFRLGTPIWIGDLCLGSSAVFLGYGILQINAMREGKVIRRDFLFSFIAMGLVVVAYLIAAFLSRMTLDVPFVAFIFIILLAIISHSLVDWGREQLETFFYRSKSHPQLRHDLREFSRTTTSDDDLFDRLSTLIKTLGQTLRVKRGIIAFREKDEFVLAVNWNGDELEYYLDDQHLCVDEIQVLELHRDEPESRQASAIVPLVAGGEQIGAMVLGHPAPPGIFSEDDVEILGYFADTVAGVIHAVRIQEEKLGQIEALIQEVEEKEKYLQSRMREVLVKDELHPFLNLKREADAISAVEEALRNLNDFAYLGDHPLANLEVIKHYLPLDEPKIITHLDRAKALHRLLITCIEKLKPLSSMPSPPSKEWYQYVILHECYVEEALNRDVMGMLYIGEGTFNRARRKAVKAITRVLAELEGNSLEAVWSSW